MAPGVGLKRTFRVVIPIFCISFILLIHPFGFSQPDPPGTIDPDKAARWTELLQRTPYPYHRPLPPEIRSSLDGTFVKLDPKPFPHVPCRRCPDYVPEGGIWKLQFDRGIMRIFYAETGWRSISSFEVKVDRLMLFNDPHCLDTLGTYLWRLRDGQLILYLVEDACAINMRAKNLTKQPWKSCQPPNAEAAVTGHWPVPPGCE
jgi:hypothetical protein